tara:strand:- start:606 stop:896 length:291 start_codon:yes stop_codon:yes gene_type:complete
MKLLRVEPSDRATKKQQAIFQYKDGTQKKIHFGATGYTDFTRGATQEQRKAYQQRHASGKNAKADTADALSYYILWGSSRSIRDNVKTFRARYKLD